MNFLRLIIILSPWIVFSQFSDDFSDGEFTNNPSWLGNIDSFEVDTNLQLHLNAPANSSISYLSTASTGSIDGNWEFVVKLDFNPSSSNKAYVYILSDSSNLLNSTQAYYVLLGNTNDDVSLYRQDGHTSTKIIDGIDDLLDVSQVEVKVKVSRDNLGNFELYIDTSSTLTNYMLQGSVSDNTYLNSEYFGVKCQYTSTRADKFWFDDFTVTAQTYVDSFPPILDSFYIENLREIQLFFNETLDSSSTFILSNYSLNNILNPVEVSYFNHSVWLRFSQNFFNTNNLQFQVNDLNNNALDTSFVFTMNNSGFQAAIINEIYADQTPSFGMPDYEFIELKNPSSDTVFLDQWKIADATDTVLIPNDTLLPNDYLILCSTAADSAYSSFGRTLAIPSFPSLNNSGDFIQLLSSYNSIIDTVNYTNDWYHDEIDDFGNNKKNGGYSLERLLQNSLCSPLYNWFPSIDSEGATPGTENSRTNYTFTTSQVNINEILVINDSTIQVKITSEAQQISSQNVNVSIVGVEQAFISAPNELTVTLEGKLSYGTQYVIEFVNLIDCYGNSLTNVSDSFFLYEPAQEGDLIINEILFNPESGGVDFLEVYNKTDKALEVNQFEIAEYSTQTPQIKTESEVLEKVKILPYSYTVFTEDTFVLNSKHYVANSNWLVECNLPNFGDDKNIVVIKVENGFTFDSIIYNKRWHFELLDDLNGVSLERINSNRESLDKSNWHSAARTYNYATPTAANSQQFNTNNTPMISITPEVFSPNNDGFKDFSLINYKNSDIGAILNLSVYDVQGRKIKDLAQNELLGTNNTWKWNGTTNNFEKAPVGIYILLFEVFTSEGKRKNIKKTVVLGTNLN